MTSDNPDQVSAIADTPPGDLIIRTMEYQVPIPGHYLGHGAQIIVRASPAGQEPEGWAVINPVRPETGWEQAWDGTRWVSRGSLAPTELFRYGTDVEALNVATTLAPIEAVEARAFYEAECARSTAAAKHKAAQENGGWCPECDRKLGWGGMAWVPHTDEFHAVLRRDMIRALIGRLQERIAAQAGHRITIRFTATEAWATCAGCGWNGYAWDDTGKAVHEAHKHLWTMGRNLYEGSGVHRA